MGFIGSETSELNVSLRLQNLKMKEEEKLELQKKELIEKLGVLMEKNHQIAPLGARIISTLILTGQKGVTFDQFVNELCASKSTISTHLDHLQTSKKIQYFTKPGDRKRYFVINPNFIIEVINETVAAWETEADIQKEVLDYKKKINEINQDEDPPPFDLEFQENFLEYLQEATTAINKLKTRIINKSSN